MFKTTMTALGLTLGAAIPAYAVDGPFPLGEVDTITSFDAMQNPNALDFYPEVAADLATAIVARGDVANESDVRPVNIDVRITSMRLNDDPVLTGNGEFNILEGFVTVRDTLDQTTVVAEPIMLRAEEMDLPYATVTPDNQDFYKAMLYAFAERAVELAEGIETLPDVGEVRN